MDEYIRLFKAGIDYSYLNDAYFYDINSQKALYWKGYNRSVNRGDALGAGRCFSNRAMKSLRWRLWNEGFDTRTDTGMDKRLAKLKVLNKHEIRCEKSNFAILDIKSKENMTPFKQWPNSRFIPINTLKLKFPEKLCRKIFHEYRINK